jgi:hypothetical protein
MSAAMRSTLQTVPESLEVTKMPTPLVVPRRLLKLVQMPISHPVRTTTTHLLQPTRAMTARWNQPEAVQLQQETDRGWEKNLL